MAELAEILKEAVFWYASAGLNVRTFALTNEEQGVYGVNVVSSPIRRQPAGVVVLARILGDKVIIEEDTTDRPLYITLMERGIPRERIILAYVGEPVPDAEKP
jgi:hypothetical protein